MKKKIKLAFVCALICCGVYHLTHSKNQVKSIVLENIEALSDVGEGSSSVWFCWSAQKKGSGCWRCGSPCVYDNNKGPLGPASTCAN